MGEFGSFYGISSLLVEFGKGAGLMKGRGEFQTLKGGYGKASTSHPRIFQDFHQRFPYIFIVFGNPYKFVTVICNTGTRICGGIFLDSKIMMPGSVKHLIFFRKKT